MIGLEKLAQFSGSVFLLLREKSREVFGNVYDLPVKKKKKIDQVPTCLLTFCHAQIYRPRL